MGDSRDAIATSTLGVMVGDTWLFSDLDLNLPAGGHRSRARRGGVGLARAGRHVRQLAHGPELLVVGILLTGFLLSAVAAVPVAALLAGYGIAR